jgi:hypothetical protein
MSAYCDKVRPPRTIPPSSNWHQSEFGCALVSPRPISANIHWYRVPPTRRDVQSVLDKLSVTTTGPPSPRHCELAKLPANVSCWPPEVASAVASKGRNFGVICPTGGGREILSSPLAKNISVFPKPKSVVWFAPSRLDQRDVTANRHEREAGCGGRGSVGDDRHSRVQRRRVVLTPRRWRQA